MNKHYYLTALSCLILITLAQAEIKLTENLSIEGFMDISYEYADISSEIIHKTIDSSGDVLHDKRKPNSSQSNFDLNEFEVDFLFNFEAVTARADIQFIDTQYDNDLELEQAYISYALTDHISLKGGRFSTSLGYEEKESTGLYQISRAYYGMGSSVFENYNEGVAISYINKRVNISLSLTESLWDESYTDPNYATELAIEYYLNDQVTLFLGAAYEDQSDNGKDTSNWIYNSYIEYMNDTLTLAAEIFYSENKSSSPHGYYPYAQPYPYYSYSEKFEKAKYFGAMLMANYAFSEKLSITTRISYSEKDAKGDKLYYDGWNESGSTHVIEDDMTSYKLTISPKYAWSENLVSLIEFSYQKSELDTEEESKVLYYGYSYDYGDSLEIENEDREVFYLAFQTIFSF